MPRSRRFLPRPAVDLHAAARAHAAKLRDEPHPDDETPDGTTAGVDPAQSQRARAQRRDQEGKFA